MFFPTQTDFHHAVADKLLPPNNSVLNRKTSFQFCTVFHFKFLIDFAVMGLNGADGYIELLTDILITQTKTEKIKYIEFPGAQLFTYGCTGCVGIARCALPGRFEEFVISDLRG